jgi:AraC-like DNA-binding protein
MIFHTFSSKSDDDKKKYLFNSKTFKKYLISYLIIFLLPIIVSTFIILNLFLVNSQNDARIQHQNFVDNASDVLAQQLEICNLNAKASTLTTMLSQYNSQLNAQRATVLVNQSEKIASIADKVFYYVYNTGTVFSSERYDDSSTILNMYTDEFPGILAEIRTIDKPRLYESRKMKICSKQYKNYLIYAVPLPWQSAHQNRAYIYLISDEKISELLELAIPINDMKAFIYDRDQIIYASDDSIYEIDDNIIQSIAKDNNIPKKILGERSMIYKQEISFEGSSSTIVMIVSRNIALEKPIHLLKVFIVSYSIIILLGFVIILVFSYSNYNPIHEITKSIRKLLSAKEESEDDISFIYNTIDMVVEEKNKVERDIDETNRLHKQRLINRYFNRQFSIDELEEELSKVGYLLKEKYFRVVAINLIETSYDAEKLIIDVMERDYDNGYNVLGAPILAFDMVVFLVGKPSESWDDTWLKTALKEITKKTPIKAIASVSTNYKREDQIFKAMTEIRLIMQFLSSYNIGSLIYYDDVIRSRMYKLSYPKSIQADLLQSIMLRNTSKINSAFDDLIEWIDTHNLPIFFIKSIFFSIVDEIFEMNLGFNTPKFCQNLYAAMEYSQFSNAKEVISKFTVIKDMVLLGINESNNKTILLNNIIAYVYNNFANPQFTISNIADEFHISSSYMRRYFKEMTGKTMHVFVDELRLEKAINLLKQTDIPLKIISREIGYYNYSSFIRKFKDFYNCTPGAYRKNYILAQEPSKFSY